MPLVSNAINLGEPWAGSQDTPAAPLWHLLEMGGFAVRIGFLDNGYLHAAERISIRTPPRVSNTPITLRFYVGEYLNNVVPTSDTRLIEIGTGTFTDSTATVQVPAWRSGHNRTLQFFVTVVNPRDLRWAPEGGYVIAVQRTAEPQKGPTQTVTPAGTDPSLDFGTARLSAGSVSIAPAGLAPTIDFGTARLGAGSVTIGVVGFADGDLGTPLLTTGGAIVAPPGAANDPSFGDARLSAGAVTIRPTGLASTFEVGPPVVSTGGAVVSVVGITSSVTVGDPVITGRRPVARTISPRSVAPQLEFGRLRFTQGKAGPRTLGVQGIDSANTFGSAVAYGLAPYSPYVVTSSIPSRTSFGNYASIRLASQPQLPPGAEQLERVIMANIASVRTAQEVLTVEIPIDLTKDTYTDPTTGVQKPIAEGTPATGIPLVKLPRGARILGGGVVTTTAITDTAAKVTLKLSEPKTNTAIFNGDDIKSAGNRPIAGSGVFFEDTPVQFALTATKITAGQIIVSLQFAVRDRADYNLGGV